MGADLKYAYIFCLILQHLIFVVVLSQSRKKVLTVWKEMCQELQAQEREGRTSMSTD